MKMLPLDASDLEYLNHIDEEEALEFLRNGLPVILRTGGREFFEVTREEDYFYAKSLYTKNVYGYFDSYIE